MLVHVKTIDRFVKTSKDMTREEKKIHAPCCQLIDTSALRRLSPFDANTHTDQVY